MAECDRTSECPRCGEGAPRAYLTAPYFAAMSVERRQAHATNERSAHAPRTLSSLGGKHGAGCSCCAPASGRKVKRGRNGAKSFPSSRPWMLSH
jgi:hypothetical protein